MSAELRGVTFPAWRNGEFIPLIDVLLVLGRWIVRGVGWRFSEAEFAPGWRGSDELNTMSHQVTLTPTETLIDLISDGVQLVDGRLEAFYDQFADPFLVVQSVRGDEWDVYAADQDILDVITEAFEGVSEIPS